MRPQNGECRRAQGKQGERRGADGWGQKSFHAVRGLGARRRQRVGNDGAAFGFAARRMRLSGILYGHHTIRRGRHTPARRARLGLAGAGVALTREQSVFGFLAATVRAGGVDWGGGACCWERRSAGAADNSALCVRGLCCLMLGAIVRLGGAAVSRPARRWLRMPGPYAGAHAGRRGI